MPLQVYCGSYRLTDTHQDLPLDVGKLVLSPTRTYAPIIKKLLESLRPHIHGIIHCSGGGQTKVPPHRTNRYTRLPACWSGE